MGHFLLWAILIFGAIYLVNYLKKKKAKNENNSGENTNNGYNAGGNVNSGYNAGGRSASAE
ncbi:MAG: hypothetical protein IKK29_03355, partial [Christensenellaceae bacterium]|nr:hypothetical protein [Christensenellaceae bacterium]